MEEHDDEQVPLPANRFCDFYLLSKLWPLAGQLIFGALAHF